MKITASIIFLVIATFSTLSQAELKIGFIDMRTALFSSNAAKAFTDKIVSQYKKQDLEVRSVGDEGQKLEQRLKNDAAIMSDVERNKTASDLDSKIAEYKFLKGKLDKALAAKRQEFLTDSKPKLDQVINEVVKEYKLDLLMPREAALYAQDSMDYTDKVIKKLNAIK